YDAVDNLHEAEPDAPPREYGRGQRLHRRGDVEYLYDEGGRRIEERVRQGAAQRVTAYRYDAAGMLATVVRPDGIEVHFTYDSFQRRVLERVYVREAGGGRKLIESRRVLWDRHVPAVETVRDG